MEQFGQIVAAVYRGRAIRGGFAGRFRHRSPNIRQLPFQRGATARVPIAVCGMQGRSLLLASPRQMSCGA